MAARDREPIMPEEPDLLSTAAAAAVLGLSRGSIDLYVKDDLLPVAERTAGGHRRFRRDDVENLARLRAFNESWNLLTKLRQTFTATYGRTAETDELFDRFEAKLASYAGLIR